MNKFEKIILSIFFVDLFVGGGGRLINIGPISIRQVLYATIILMYIVRVIKTKNIMNKKVNQFISFNIASLAVYLLIGSFIISTLIGYLNGHPKGEIMTDFLRVSFIGLYFPFAYYVQEERYEKKWIVDILKVCGLIAAIFTIVIDVAGKFIFVSDAAFLKFYKFTNSFFASELYFRASRGVFYKAHLYILFALIICLYLWLNKKANLLDKITVFITIVSIIWSETRGILLALMLAIIVIMFIDSKIRYDQLGKIKDKLKATFSGQHLKKIVICIILLVSLPVVYKYTSLMRSVDDPIVETNKTSKNSGKDSKQITDKSIGTRMLIIKDSALILTEGPRNMLIGSGYGTKIAENKTGIEISFLDILVEQGIVGLLIWLFISLMPVFYYYKGYKARKYQIETTDVALLTCLAAMLLLTNTNPFINNSIGMIFLILILIFSKNSYESTKNRGIGWS